MRSDRDTGVWKFFCAIGAAGLLTLLPNASFAQEQSKSASGQGSPALADCPLDLGLDPGRTATAFRALPKDLEEQAPDDHCRPATVLTMIMRPQGLCKIGGVTMPVASLITLKQTGRPLAIMFLTNLSQQSHAQLQSALEQRYSKQPLSAYKGPLVVQREITSVVRHKGGTLLMLEKQLSDIQGNGMSIVQQFAPEDVNLVNRSLNSCK
ncbi:MAG TPA: hypothetical protein VD865_04390 [Stenotrophomonas sp.]|nr:hypothetical protein [Stenotrophomonas sp.]